MTLPVDPQLLLDQGPVVSYVYDRHRQVFTYLSANLADWLRLPLEAMLENPHWQAQVMAADRAALVNHLTDTSPGWRPLRARLQGEGGRIVHIEDRPLQLPAGDGLRVGHWLNVTAEELDRAARARSDRELEDVVRDLTDIYYRTDRDGNLVRVSGAALDLFAAPIDQVFGSRVADYYLEPDGRARFLEALTEAGGRIHAYQAPMRRHDGKIIWISTSAHFVYDDKGEIDGVEGMVRDITAQKEAEAALRAERDFNHTVLNTVNSVLVVLDREGRIVSFNHAAEQLTGYTFAELQGRPVWDHLILPEEIRGVKDVFSRLVSGMFPNTYENYWRTKAGDRKLIAWSNACMTDAAGGVTYVVSSGIDITEQRQSLLALQASEERFRELAESINEVFWLGSPDWQQVYYISPAYEEIWGDSVESLYAAPMSWMDRIHPDDLPAVRDYIANVDLTKDQMAFPEYRLERPDGEVRWIAARAYPIRGEDGTTLRIAGTAEDITQRHVAEELLRQSGVAFENTNEAIMVLDADCRILTVNRAFSDITGYDTDRVTGRRPEALFGADDAQSDGMPWESLFANDHWQGETLFRRADGEPFPAWCSVSPVYDQRGALSAYVCLFSDISSIKKSQQELDFLAHHDPLTRLPNRLLLSARLEVALQQAHRQDSHVAVLFIDLDRFKHINDSLGHSVGDQLLISAAERLRNVMREEDTLARLGGDEFVIAMHQLPDSQDAMALAERIIALMRQPFSIAGHRLHVSASLGISTYPQDGTDIDTLMKNADAAMYRAKEQGRDNYQFYTDELTRSAIKRVTLENALRRALQKDELVLHYQPQICLATGQILGAEALVRWEHPELGLVAPNQFIPLAEETGLILPLGEWVMHAACAQARKWIALGLGVERVAVNLSGVQIQRSDVRDLARSALRAAGLGGHQLEVELTESTLMHGESRATRALDALRELDVQVAIDDFGTGYSSLSYLKRLPIDRLKIDREFIRDVGSDPNDEAIIRAVIAMAHTLQLEVVAEGVETEMHHGFLTQLTCDAAQGFLYGRPLTAAAFADLCGEDSLLPSARN